MTTFIQARLVGFGTSDRMDTDWYHHGQLHDIGVRQHTFSKRITVFKTRGKNNEIPDSRHEYPNLGAFLLDWGDITEVTVEPF